MNKYDLSNKKIAILATDGFEQIELTKPRAAVEEAGASTAIVSLETGKIQGFNHFEKGDQFNVDLTVKEASASDFDGLLLPGGVHNPDTLRLNKNALSFIRDFFSQHKPVAAICHAPWTLIEAGVVKGRKITSWPSLQTDIENAGGTWVDEEVVVDEGFTTSRKPDDLDAFCSKAVEEFAEGKHAEQTA